MSSGEIALEAGSDSTLLAFFMGLRYCHKKTMERTDITFHLEAHSIEIRRRKMATLTFLRIGKAIHDELEDCLAEHLLERETKGLKKMRRKVRKSVHVHIANIIKWIGFGNLL